MNKKQPAAALSEAEKQKRVQLKQEALKKLATKRVNKVIKMYAGIGNLANYKPTAQQVAIIETALGNAHNLAIKRLKGTAETAGDFAL
jgi:hypothetical protein